MPRGLVLVCVRTARTTNGAPVKRIQKRSKNGHFAEYGRHDLKKSGSRPGMPSRIRIEPELTQLSREETGIARLDQFLSAVKQGQLPFFGDPLRSSGSPKILILKKTRQPAADCLGAPDSSALGIS